MAIKTKKISDLSEIKTLDNDCYFVGHKNNETSKISYATISEDVRNIVAEQIGTAMTSLTQTLSASVAPAAEIEENEPSTDVETLLTVVNELKAEINDIAERYKVLNKNYTNFALASAENIFKLQEDNTKLIQFVKALQKDSYLTLAEIKKAATEAFPVEESSETTSEE